MRNLLNLFLMRLGAWQEDNRLIVWSDRDCTR
jgi:hypothetical protein